MLGRIMLTIGLAMMMAAFYSGVAVIATRADPGIPRLSLPAQEALAESSDSLGIMTWNIGYAGLGAESDFIMDGGRMLLPPGGGNVRRNLEGIASVLGTASPDILLMQEVARPGLLTRNVDVLGGVAAALPGYSAFFSSDIRTRLIPGPLGLQHGLASFTRLETESTELIRLAEEETAIMGFIQRRYHLQVTELEMAGQPWTVINVHLSAFDAGGETRRRQLAEALDIAQSYYQRGRAVIMGGDWNMRLAPTDFAYTTGEDALFWVQDFPMDSLRPGWRIVTDPSVPTSRTNEQPYSEGVNYTSIIDGFIISPNVAAEEVRTLDLGFRHSDHQPVIARFRRLD